MNDRSSGRRLRDARSGDALGHALEYVRLTEGTYCRCELGRPWGISFSRQEQARFHVVVAGDAWLRQPNGGWTALHAGDVLLLPQGSGHALADRARGAVTPLGDLPLEPTGDGTFVMKMGGHAPGVVLVCCSVTFDQPLMRPVVDAMPKLLLLRGGAVNDAISSKLIAAMAEEARSRRIGTASVMTRLADVLITSVIRAWAESTPDEASGWLAAMRDPHIGRALAAIHDQPGKPWSIESLARVARSSRSVFAERFASLVGMPPARYLTRFRMAIAASWFEHERVTVVEAAHRLGYESEAAFSRAFKRSTGFAPTALRKRKRSR